ncbi:tetratricopeptide repeat protein [Chitinophaga oryzae]|uniref:Tetratricopeptide repeat protein n=1 Tax=Chitinophaga oryzae TaxID=2725414 RepID=A0AAE7D7N3_9BACT|nr:tetratricopeptide repeat protein [Chitinophaga oryzae]QJB32567.1 tetratricopeptide repeat protein [Chitinophaga oryzae]
MKIKFYTLIATTLLSGLLFYVTPAYGQSVSRLLRRADRAHRNQQLVSALRYYKQVYARQPDNRYAVKNIALLQLELRHYSEALTWFEKIDFDKEAPDCLRSYVRALANNERYREADSCLKVYRTRTNKSPDVDFTRTDELLKDSSRWHIDYLSINSSLDEFSPVMYGHNFVFVTNQYLPTGLKMVDRRNERPFLQLRVLTDTGQITCTDIRKLSRLQSESRGVPYILNADNTPPASNDSRVTGTYYFGYQPWKGVKRPSYENNVLVLDRKIETKYHEGPATFSSRFDTIYFTRNNYTPGRYRADRQGISRLKIFRATFHNGRWRNIVSLPFNSNEYSTGHPALSKDGSTLFFVSDMPGGMGGKDLYFSRKMTDGSWGKPVNAGPLVNTAGDEMFPYLDDNNNLYFSSDGLAGLGGLDIFRAGWVNGTLTGPAENLGYPLNTSKDDYGIWCIHDATGLHGFFSSDRLGDDDLFRFRLQPLRLTIKGSVYLKQTGLREPGVKISLVNATNRKDTISDITGNFEWPLAANTDYQLCLEKKGLEKRIIPVSTKGISRDSILTFDIYMEYPPDAFR